MARGGGGGRSGSRSGGFRSSRFRSRSSGTSLKSPSAPDEVVVRYSNGGPVRVVRPSEVEGAAFQSNLYSEYDKYGTPSGSLPFPCEGNEFCSCKKLLMSAIETTLFDGCNSHIGLSCRHFLERYCGVKVDIGALKKGSTCSGPVQK